MRCRKNLLLIILILALSVAAMTPSADASPEPIISVDPNTKTVDAVGITFTVNLTITDVTGMASWQAGLTFNGSILNCTGIVEGPLLKSYGTTIWIAGSIDNDLGIIYPCSSTLAPPVGVDVAAGEIGVLATLTFLATGVGETSLHVGPDPVDQNVYILDETGSPITPFDTEDGSIVVLPEFPAALIMPLFMVATLAVAILGKIVWSKKRREPTITK